LRSKTVYFSKQNTKSFKINSKEEAYNKKKYSTHFEYGNAAQTKITK